MCEQRDNLETHGMLEASKEERKKICKKKWSNEQPQDNEKIKVLYHIHMYRIL